MSPDLAPKGGPPDPQELLDNLGVGSFATREIMGPGGQVMTVADAMVQCPAVGQAIKGTIEGSRRTVAQLGMDVKKFDPSAAMEGWLDTMSDGEGMREAHEAHNVDSNAVLAQAEKK